MSEQETVPDAGSNASEMITLFPAATPAAGTMTVRVVPVLVVEIVPTVFTKEIAACAWEFDKTIRATIVVKQRRYRFISSFSL